MTMTLSWLPFLWKNFTWHSLRWILTNPQAMMVLTQLLTSSFGTYMVIKSSTLHCLAWIGYLSNWGKCYNHCPNCKEQKSYLYERLLANLTLQFPLQKSFTIMANYLKNWGIGTKNWYQQSFWQSWLGYLLSVILFPFTLQDDLEKLMNSFWWGGNNLSRKGMH